MTDEEEAWVEDNAERVAEALARPETQQELSELVGGQPDPEREREKLAHELSRMRLEWRSRRPPKP
jgi:hypothetical protein